MNDKKDLIQFAIRIALALALLFPVYALLFITFPASLVAIYLVSAVLAALFMPWDKLKKKFLS